MQAKLHISWRWQSSISPVQWLTSCSICFLNNAPPQHWVSHSPPPLQCFLESSWCGRWTQSDKHLLCLILPTTVGLSRTSALTCSAVHCLVTVTVAFLFILTPYFASYFWALQDVSLCNLPATTSWVFLLLAAQPPPRFTPWVCGGGRWGSW